MKSLAHAIFATGLLTLSALQSPAAADACDTVMANGTYNVSLTANGNSASAYVDFNVISNRKCKARECPLGFHHNIASLTVNGQSAGAFDIASDCYVNNAGYADFALHGLTNTGHLGAIAAEWQFAPTAAKTQFIVTDDFRQTPGSVYSLTANMQGTAAH